MCLPAASGATDPPAAEPQQAPIDFADEDDVGLVGAEAEARPHLAAVGADQLRRVLGDPRPRRTGVDRRSMTAPLLPDRPARSTPVTAMPWLPSRRGAGTLYGEAQGWEAPPSISTGEGDRAVGAELDRRPALAAERRRRLGDRDRRRQRQRRHGAEGVDQAGADRRWAEAADRPGGRGQAPARTCAAEAPGFAWRISAATAAACGAAAEVPKKRQALACEDAEERGGTAVASPARSGLAMVCRRSPAPGRRRRRPVRSSA